MSGSSGPPPVDGQTRSGLQPGEIPPWFEGAIDVHVHSSPSIFPRLLDDFGVVAQAEEAGMAAVVLKAHEGSTVERAALASVGPLVVRGGLVLNRFVGGVNPQAVELAIAMGAAVIWMPTLHAGNHLDHYGVPGFSEQSAGYRPRPVESVQVLDEDGGLVEPLHQVLEILAAHPEVVLNNGHLGAEETLVLFRAAREQGLEKLVVAHPELPLTDFDLEAQLQMVELGALIERCYLPHTERWGGYPLERTAREIERLGVENCLLSTDFGQVDNPPPAKGLLEFGTGLQEHGISTESLETMLRRNPGWLLGLG